MTLEQILAIAATILGGSGGLWVIIRQVVKTQTAIALMKAEGERDSDKSTSQQMSSLIDLLRQQILQQAQQSAQNAQIEADKITAQNNLAMAVREATEETRLAVKSFTINTENALQDYARTIKGFDVQLRNVADDLIHIDTVYMETTRRINSALDTITGEVKDVRSDVSQLAHRVERLEDKIDDTVELHAAVHNTVAKMAGLSGGMTTISPALPDLQDVEKTPIIPLNKLVDSDGIPLPTPLPDTPQTENPPQANNPAA